MSKIELPTVDLATHVEQTNDLMTATADRYAMPTISVAMLRQGAQKGLHKLLGIIESDKFDELDLRDQLGLVKFFTDHAYGKADSALAALALAHKTGTDPGNSGDHAAQLDAIEARMGEAYPELKDSNPASEAPASQPHAAQPVMRRAGAPIALVEARKRRGAA